MAGKCELKDAVEEWLEKLASPNHTILFEWVPSHCGVRGNEEADREAAEAAKLGQEGVHCSFAGVRRRLCEIERRRTSGVRKCTEQEGSE